MTVAAEFPAPRFRDTQRVPDFFIVGHAKSGTTALYEMLREHPQIHMPDEKEPWYFSTDMRARFKPRTGGLGPQTLEQYLALFAGAASVQRVGEASSSYLWSTTAAAEIAAVQPDARIVAILREPADFLRSLHLQLLQTHVEEVRDLRGAIALEAERAAGRQIPRHSHRPQLLQYSTLVRYVEQLRRYEAVFPSEQILVLIYDDFRADNAETVRRVLALLELAQQQPVVPIKANPTVRMRSQRLDDIVHATSVGTGPLGRVAKASTKALVPQRLRRNALRFAQQRIVHARPDPLDEDFMNELRRRFLPEVQALSEHLGRDLLALWGYDELS
jgi:hypothetical protein